MIHAPKFPLRFKEKKVFENVGSTKELVTFHLTNLLLTNPGEKISDPEYGIGLRRMLFENMTEGTLNNWSRRITDSIKKYLTYIDLNNVEIIPFFDQNKVNIKISFKLLKDTEQQVLEIELNIGNSGSSAPTY
jgi:phage baseplate assembly protein W